jgi:hypothetical protein
MFFSSAITLLLPYLLFFGVLSTLFFGITEKIFPQFGSDTHAEISFTEQHGIADSDQSFYWDGTDEQFETETDFCKEYPYNTLQGSITVIFQQLSGYFAVSSEKNTPGILTILTLRGPPLTAS